jgi:hypothetical protein
MVRDRFLRPPSIGGGRLFPIREAAMALTEGDKAQCMEIARAIIKEVLVEHVEMCPHGRLLKNWKWLALGILLGVSIVAGSSSAVTALVLTVF